MIHKPRVTRTEKPVWTPEQLKLIVASVPQQYRSLFECAMLTGARLGELLGLQWRNIYLPEERLEIRQALWEGQMVSPKTEGSVRVIYFGPSLLATLTNQQRTATHSERGDLTFCKEDGSPLNPDVLRRVSFTQHSIALELAGVAERPASTPSGTLLPP